MTFPASFDDLMHQGLMHDCFEQHEAAWLMYLRAARYAPTRGDEDVALMYAAFAFDRDPCCLFRLAALMGEQPRAVPQADGDSTPMSDERPHGEEP